jgi:hypothetical protein
MLSQLLAPHNGGAGHYYSVIVNYIAFGCTSFKVAVISELPGRGTARRWITFDTFTDGGMHLLALIP